MQFRFPEDDRFSAWKISFLQFVIAGVFAVLLIGYWRLQIGQHAILEGRAERNRIRDLPIIAPRGRILDRGGRILADNRPSFTILLTREVPDLPDSARVQEIASGLGIDPSDLASQIKSAVRLPRFQPIVIKTAATLADVAFVESHEMEYPELEAIPVQQRYYPQHQLAAQVLGYVGEVSENEINKPHSPYRPGDVVGRFGVEEQYNSVLMGRDGMRRVVVNSRGQEVGSLSAINAIPGHDLRLTIDLDLQRAADEALGDRPGAVVALDPADGEVLAMVSHPAFDPNDFAHGLDPATWRELTSNPMKPLMNKAIQAQLAPGSVFKIVTAAAALETGTITPKFTVDCKGEATIYGHTYHDWVWWKYHRGHGVVDLHRAIEVSCDVYFYTLGKMLGIDKLDYFARHLGLGKRTGIDLPAEDSGLVPSPSWVERVFKRQWWPGETIPVAIGQGALQVTPLQLAYALGGIASGGRFARPYVAFPDELQSLGLDPPSQMTHGFPLHDATVSAVTSGMWGVVNSDGGTGAGARCPGIDIGGKTGTAQVVSASLQEKDHRKQFIDNAWFVGLSPSRNPKIAVAVLVMNGGHSSVATPIAASVIKAFYRESQPGKPNLEQSQTPAVRARETASTTERSAGGETGNTR
jgi:penicillin-binding protein 2